MGDFLSALWSILMRLQRFILSAVAALVTTHMASAMADTVEISGSTTVNSVLVTPFKAEIERQSGHTLKITPSNSGEGLTDLIGFSADIAMTSAPFKDVAEQVGKNPNFRGLTVEEREFNVVPLGRAEVLFIVNPSNKVGHLSRTQLAGLLSGSIKNWHEVGGDDQAVVLVSENATGAMRTEIIRKVLGGKDLPSSVKLVELATDAPKLVAATPGAIGFISSAMPASQREGVTVVPHEGKIEQTLYIITRPGSKVSVEKVVRAIKAVGDKALSR